MIEAYLGELAEGLHVTRRHRERIVAEVRDHLEDRVRAHRAGGLDATDAERRAVSSFGSAHELAARFGAETATAAMRRLPLTMAIAGGAVGFGLLIAVVPQPHATTSAPVRPVVQVAFFTAALALQVGFVAGLRLASLVAAWWRMAAAPVVDRRLIRRAGAVCLAGMALATVGWSIAVVLSLRGVAHPRPAAFIAGIGVMVTAVVAAAFLFAMRGLGAGDEDTYEPVRDPGVLGWGERAIALSQRWPWLSCAIVAAIGALGAMSHAETTFAHSLIWGCAEAVTVVASYVVLGPVLGLRAAGADHGPERSLATP